MKFPKYSCSVCRRPSSRKWNLVRHINNCHAGIGICVSNWDFPEDTYGLHWNRWKAGASQKERSHYIRPDLLTHFLSSNESNDRKPFDYYHVLAEAVLKEFAKMGVSTIQPTQSRISFPFSPMSSIQYPNFRIGVCIVSIYIDSKELNTHIRQLFNRTAGKVKHKVGKVYM
jgi:hypothetical protein